MTLSLIVLASVLFGLLLLTCGVVVMALARGKREQLAVGLAIVCLGVLTQSWWIVLAAMFLFKTVILRQST